MENKQIKVLILLTLQKLITEIEEVSSELGEPDCKLIKPFLINDDENTKTLSPYLSGLTNQSSIMMSSDKILTLVDPTPTLLEKYQNVTK